MTSTTGPARIPPQKAPAASLPSAPAGLRVERRLPCLPDPLPPPCPPCPPFLFLLPLFAGWNPGRDKEALASRNRDAVAADSGNGPVPGGKPAHPDTGRVPYPGTAPPGREREKRPAAFPLLPAGRKNDRCRVFPGE